MRYVGILIISFLAFSTMSCRSASSGPNLEPASSQSSAPTPPTNSSSDNSSDALADSIPDLHEPGTAPTPTQEKTEDPAQKLKLKLIFDTTDNDAILNCGGQTNLTTLTQNSKFGGDNLQVSNIKLPDTDPMAIINFVAPQPLSPTATVPSVNSLNTPSSLYDFLLDKFPSQKIEGQSFWDFTKTKFRGLEYSNLTRQKPRELEASKTMIYDFFLRTYDIKEDLEKVRLGSAFFYRAKTKPPAIKHITITMDLESAWWLRIQSDRLAECLEKEKYAAEGSSRESLRNWAFASLSASFGNR